METVVTVPVGIPEAVYWPLTRHKSAFVRARACQALGEGEERISLDTLCRVLSKDKSPLVRGYAVLSLVQLSEAGRAQNKDEVTDFLAERYDAESSDWVGTILLEGMVRLGDLSLFPELRQRLTHPQYRVRLMTAAALGVLSGRHPELREDACREAQKALQTEKHPGVKEKLIKLCYTPGS